MRRSGGSGSAACAAGEDRTTCQEGGGRHVRCPRTFGDSQWKQIAKADQVSDRDAQYPEPKQRNNRSEIFASNA